MAVLNSLKCNCLLNICCETIRTGVLTHISNFCPHLATFLSVHSLHAMHCEGEEEVGSVFRKYQDYRHHDYLHFTDKVLFDGTFGGECVQYYECFDPQDNYTHAYIKLKDRLSPAATKELHWLMKLRKACSERDCVQFARVLGFQCHHSFHCVIFKEITCKLSEYLRKSELALAHRHQLCEDICSGLYFLHTFSPRVIHCAVTPESILVCAGGTARLCDLSRAHYLQEGSRRHKIEESIRSVISKLLRGMQLKKWEAVTKQKLRFTAAEQPYLSPECKTTRTVDEKHDVFSLGVVIMEVLTGNSPTPRGPIGKDEIHHRRSHDIEALRQTHPCAAEVVVEYCLQQDPILRSPVVHLLPQLQRAMEEDDVGMPTVRPATTHPCTLVSCCVAYCFKVLHK